MRQAKGRGSIYPYRGGYRGAITIHGKRHYVTGKTKKQTSDRLEELKENLGYAPERNQKESIYQWCVRWLDTTSANRRPSTNDGYNSYIQSVIKNEIGHIPLTKVDTATIEALYSRMRAAGKSTSAMRQTHAILRGALDRAVTLGKLKMNPARLIPAPTGRPAAPSETLSHADVQHVLKAASGERWHARWAIALLYGLRPSEALGLEWRHLDGDRLTIVQQLQPAKPSGVRIAPLPKTAAGKRTIYLPPQLVDMIEQHRELQLIEMAQEGSNYQHWEHPTGTPRSMMWRNPNGKPLMPWQDITAWKRILSNAGLPHTRRYTARHTAASRMFAQQVDAATIAAALGHADAAFTLKTYVHSDDQRMRKLSKIVSENLI